jgi:hypothetical protein
MSSSDAEFNSASNGDIFTHGKTIGEKFYLDFYFSPYRMKKFR